MLGNYAYNPFRYPYMITLIDVSGKRNVNIYDRIDRTLIESGMKQFEEHLHTVKQWEDDFRERVSKVCFPREEANSSPSVWIPIICIALCLYETKRGIPRKTRYTQKNYVRYPYKVQEACDSKAVSFNFLNDRYKKLHGIGRSMKLSEYEQNDQRKNMTKQLRGKIAKRDTYTCQHCGKYMPDGVGLQIDHIVPISKEGKSIPENLQVLCSKCNGSKSNK